jgi:predicted esterase
LVVVSNGTRDPTIPATLTAQLVSQLRERRADVVELPHAGGHQIDPAVLPKVRVLLASL